MSGSPNTGRSPRDTAGEDSFSVVSGIHYRHFMVTGGQMKVMGQAEEGDEAWILYEVRSLLILRQQGQSYKIVGEAVVQIWSSNDNDYVSLDSIKLLAEEMIILVEKKDASIKLIGIC
jgi:hypothetical protein